MKWISLYLAFFIFFIYSCGSSKNSANKPATNNANIGQIQLITSNADELRIDPYQLDSLKIIQNELLIFVTYGGGCGEAHFELFRTQLILNSFPPQSVLHLSFADEDPCRALESRVLKYSMEPFKDYYSNDGIWLRVAGTDKQVLYKDEKKN